MNQLIAIKQHIVKNKKTIIRCFWILLLINTFPFFYIGKSIEGVVTDESGAPIEGVVALMQHYVETTNGHEIHKNSVYIAETVTDKKGRYRFSWWVAPRRHILGWRLSTSPHIDFFKNGYSSSGISNHSKVSGWPSVYVFSDIPQNVVLKTVDLELESDEHLFWYTQLFWYTPPKNTFRSECRKVFLPLYTKEADKFIESVNPIRKQRGLPLLKGSKDDETVYYCS